MFASRSTRTTAKVLAQLAKDHRKRLRDGEEFLAAVDAFSADEYDPTIEAKSNRPFTDEERLSARGVAHLRLAAVRSEMGMINQEFTEIPRSKSGYVIALTQTRLFFFDGAGKNVILDEDLDGVWLQPFEHPDDLYTLVFGNQTTRIAVTTQRASVDLATHFVATFPDRRNQPRIPQVSGEPRIAEF